MRTNYLKLLPLLLLLVVRCARETTIELPEEDPKTVVVCYFKPGELFQMELSRSQSVFSGQDFVPVTEADATLSVKGEFWNRLRYKYDSEQDRFLWVSRDTAQAGVTYTLTVRVPEADNALVDATSSIPRYVGLLPIEMDAANTRTVQLPDGTFALRVPITLRLKYLPTKGRYFAFQLSHETLVSRVVNGNPVVDYTYQTSTNFTTDGRTLSLLNDISEAEPIVLINEKYWSDNDPTLSLDAIIPFQPGRERPTHLFVEWRTLSEEFYRYHLSLARQGGNLPLSDPDAVFNNVNNGYGNFSGYSVGHDTLLLPK